MAATRLVVVGGFLGSGKTTLLYRAARELAGRGLRVGVVTNDQAPDLVDTRLLAGQGVEAEEVTGSCFCCNFLGLIQAARRLHARLDADVIFAEPVGSCADLSATLLQPLKAAYEQEFALAPFTVLADPVRLREVLGGTDAALHPSAAYIVRKQLEEADIIAINKVDEADAQDLTGLRRLIEDAFPDRDVRPLSALAGTGVREWLDDVLSGRRGGGRVVEVDYDRYAEGEAALGWLNAVVRLRAREWGTAWPTFCRDLLGGLQEALRQREAQVGHVKLLLSRPGGFCVGNLTRRDGRVSVQDSGPARGDAEGPVSLTLNARVEIGPEELERIVRSTVRTVCGEAIEAEFVTLSALTPGRPQPTYRYTDVVP
jgi:Ni2+-binding GTPase involved in maturation of urease and hydrogenase